MEISDARWQEVVEMLASGDKQYQEMLDLIKSLQVQMIDQRKRLDVLDGLVGGMLATQEEVAAWIARETGGTWPPPPDLTIVGDPETGDGEGGGAA